MILSYDYESHKEVNFTYTIIFIHLFNRIDLKLLVSSKNIGIGRKLIHLISKTNF